MNSNPLFFFMKPWAIYLALGFFKITTTYAIVLPEFVGGIKAESLYSLSNSEVGNIFVHCLKTTHTDDDYRACIVPILMHHGASIQSVAFAKQFGSWITAFQTYSNVSVVEANAARAPEHQRVFINNEGVALNFDDASIVNTKLLASNPEYQALLSTYPDCILGFNTRTPEIKKANDGGQFFDITYPLLNGCIACQHIGEAVLRFQFDAHGNYQNLSLMRVTSTV